METFGNKEGHPESREHFQAGKMSGLRVEGVPTHFLLSSPCRESNCQGQGGGDMWSRNLSSRFGDASGLSTCLTALFGSWLLCFGLINFLFLCLPSHGWCTSTPMKSYEWMIERVDATKLFYPLSNRSLRVDQQGHPHIVYGGDFLYYAWQDGAQWHTETVDDSQGTGRYPSLALDSAGNPHIAYYDGGERKLKYAVRTGSNWVLHVIDSGYDGIGYFAIAIDRGERPHIVYYDPPQHALKHATWVDSTWEIETIDTAEGDGGVSVAFDLVGNMHVGYCKGSGELVYGVQSGSGWNFSTVGALGGNCKRNSFALDKEGNPNFAFQKSDQLKYARWVGSGWDFETVDGVGNADPNVYPSLAVDQGQAAHIAYQDQKYKYLKYARWNGESWDVQVLDNEKNTGRYVSIDVDSFGCPHIGYLKNLYGPSSLRYAWWNDAVWRVETVDMAGKGGAYSSMALDAWGSPHISYFDETKGELKYARKTDETWISQVVDNVMVGGHTTSLRLDGDGNVHISYYDTVNRDLKYAHGDGTNWDIQTVASEGDVGWYSSLALDRDGNPRISYQDYTNNALKYARWTGSSWEIETVDPNRAGAYASLALDSHDDPHIAYFSSGGALRYARWTGMEWTIEAIPDVRYGSDISLVLDGEDRPHISFCGPPRYARKRDGAWEVTIFDPKAMCQFTSIALDSRSHPHISYYDGVGYYATSRNLKYARWTGSAWDVQVIESGWGIGLYSSLGLDREDRPHISYFDEGLGDLKYAYGRLVGQDISVFPSVIDFGEILLGQQLNQTIVIKNDGVAELELETIGTPASPFGIVGGSCVDGQVLLPTEECSIIVQFAPVGLGNYTSEFTITSNDLDESEVVATLKGKGVYPDISVSPVTLKFGSVNVGALSPPQLVKVTNDGSAILHISELILGGEAPSHFVILEDGCGGRSLGVKEGCSFQILFHPKSVGSKSAQVSIVSDDMNENPTVVVVDGVGVEPDVEVAPLFVDFGNLRVGDASHKTILVRNEGLGELTITSIGSLSAPYRLVKETCAPGLKLPPGGSCSIIIRFEPSEGGTFSRSFFVSSDDPDEPNIRVELTGRSDGTPGRRVTFPSEIPRIDPLNNWHWRNPLPHGLDIADVAYGKGTFVAVGDQGAIVTSFDGVTWTVVPSSGSKASLGGVAFGNGKFVAVGSVAEPGHDRLHGCILTSSDGTNWKVSVKRMNEPLYSVAFLNNEFMVVGGSNCVYTSSDGNVWSSRIVGRASFLSAVTYGGGIYVAVGYYEENADGLNSRGCIFTSPDGKEWTERVSGTRWSLGSVAYGNGTFVVSGSQLLTSADGITWTPIEGGEWPGGVLFAKGHFIGLGREKLFSSIDGRTWETRAVVPYFVTGIAYAGERFFAVGRTGILYLSSDGLNWTNERSWRLSVFKGVAFGKGVYVGCGGRYLYTSPDGVDWTTVDLLGSYDLIKVAFGGDRFVAIDKSGSTFASVDGTNWRRGSVPGSPSLTGVTYGKGLFVAVGNEGEIFTSTDGLSWVKRVSPSPRGNSKILYGNETFVAYGGTIWKSEDGIVWIEFPLWEKVGTLFWEMIYGNGIYVATSSKGIFTSTDAITWTQRDAYFHHLAYGNGLFIGFWEGVLYVSPDGAKWTKKELANTNGLGEIGFEGGTFFTWTLDGKLQQSDHMRGPRIAWSAQTTDFGKVALGNSVERTLVLRNEGTDDLAIGILSPPSKAFDILREDCSGSTLAPEQTCAIVIRFIPSSTGEFKSTCRVPSNDPDRPVVDLGLRGESVAPDLRGRWVSVKTICESKCKIAGVLEIENAGTRDAPSSVVRFYLSDDGAHYGNDGFLKRVSTGPIKAGASKFKRLNYNLSPGGSAFGKYLIAVIDAEKTVVEDDETNNHALYYLSGP
jgi:hypothetical protein